MLTEYPIELFGTIGIFIILDIATGLSQAAFNKTIDSKILRNGMFHKLSYIFAIVLALSLEYACNYMELGFECKVLIPLAIYIVITEAVSVLENIMRINPELSESPLFKLLSSTQNRRSEDTVD